MNKKAIIFFVPTGKKTNGLPQGEIRAEEDKFNWVNYLQSKAGGGWLTSEIETYKNPPAALMRSVTLSHRQFSNLDAAYIIFAGHGWVRKDSFGNKLTDYVVSGDGFDIDLNDLAASSKQNYFFTDSCRELSTDSPNLGLLEESFKATARLFSSINEAPIELVRQAYNERLSLMPNGNIKCYSCSLNEVSDDNSNGGFYTQSLLGAGRSKASNLKFGQYCTLDDIHAASIPNVRQLSNNVQNPDIHAGRRLTYPPFAMGYKL